MDRKRDRDRDRNRNRYRINRQIDRDLCAVKIERETEIKERQR